MSSALLFSMSHFPQKAQERPTVSYGIILLFYGTTKNLGRPLVMVYQRRDSYEYIDLIKGAYKTKSEFKELISHLCQEERKRIIEYSFEQLWDDLWISPAKRGRVEEYESAKEKFELYKSHLTSISSSPKMAIELPWSFPKGRKSKKEDDMECALREFTEETNIPISSIEMLKIKPYVEIYRGSDNKLYRTEYFIAVAATDFNIDSKIESDLRSTASNEASKVRWMTLGEACLKLEPRRYNILKGVIHLVHATGLESTPGPRGRLQARSGIR
jgi:ADP-ribose pyrophosphatase YjhB (NUDIX family)